MKKRICSILLLVSLIAPAARAGQTSTGPIVTVTPPPSVKAKKWSLFPLRMPAYVLRGVTWPLVAGIRLFEDKWLSKSENQEKKKKNYFAFPIIQVGGGEGFGMGFSFHWEDLFNAGDFATDYTFFLDIDNRANLMFTGNPMTLAGRPFQYDFIFRWRDRNHAEYFGIGSDTPEQDVGEYAYNQMLTGVDLQYEILPHLKIILPLQFMMAEANSADGSNHPPVQDIFPASELAGFEQRTSYFVAGLQIAHDTLDSPIYPLKGGYRSFQFIRFQDLSAGDFSFNQYAIDIRQYFPLWHPRYVLMLRNAWIFQQATGDSTIPFNLLTDLDHYSPLRGFVVGRFRDTSSVIFNLEYHFPIWSFVGMNLEEANGYHIDGMLFFDNGRVFPGISNFAFADWHFAGGGGLNVLVHNKLLMLFEAGWGGEGPLIFFRLGSPL